MYRLDPAIVEALEAGHALIVPSRQRAAAVRIAYAWRRRLAGASVWATPDVLPWDAWLSRELMRAREAGGEQRALLNPSQQQALWQQVLREEAADETEADLLAAHADGIATAAALVREWRLEWPRGSGTAESDLLRRALARMDARCARDGLLAPALCGPADLARLAPRPLAFALGTPLTPRQRAVVDRFGAAGVPARDIDLPAPAGTARAMSLASPEEEHLAICEWARELLAADPGARLLVVAARPEADLALLREDLLAAIGAAPDAHTGVALEGGDALEDQPLVRAALDWLQLAGGDVEFATLSAVLRGPHHGLAEMAACVRLELWLRERMPVRCATGALLELLGRAPEGLGDPARSLATALRAARDLAEASPAPPGEWSRRVTVLLKQVGFPGTRPLDSAGQQARERWQQALEEFATLDRVMPPLGAEAAVGRLRALLRRSQHQAATGDAAVTLTSRREDPVVGYDAIHVFGAGELQFPAPARPDPFVPASVQRAAGLPQATARGSLAAGRRLLEAWQARGGAVTLSWARTESDIDQSPSVLLRNLPVVERTLPGRPAMPRQVVEEAATLALSRAASAPPGGSRIPELQQACAFRAQAELRLGAERPQRPAGGIDGRLRGIYLHRALERLWGAIRSSAVLQSRSVEEWGPEIDAAVDAAFSAPVPGGGVAPTPRQIERERKRCRRLVEEALAAELARTQPFTVVARERPVTWRVDDTEIALRIDRIDRLADGSLVVLDYKTGAGPVRASLEAEAPGPAQLMAYLDAISAEDDADIASLALVGLQPGAVSFQGLDDGRAGLPRGRRAAAPEDWPALRGRLRETVRGLVRDHVAGDARVAPLEKACRYCPLPALCRIDLAALATDEEGEE